jgi:nitrogen fixation protein NifX
MSYKIAVASTDGKVVNEHFGRADKFLIVEVNDKDEFSYQETRETDIACKGGTHDEDGLARTVDLLSDCKYVLVKQIGPGAEYALSKKGVTAFAIAHYIDEAVKKLIHYNSEVKLQK